MYFAFSHAICLHRTQRNFKIRIVFGILFGQFEKCLILSEKKLPLAQFICVAKKQCHCLEYLEYTTSISAWAEQSTKMNREPLHYHLLHLVFDSFTFIADLKRQELGTLCSTTPNYLVEKKLLLSWLVLGMYSKFHM